MFQDLRGLLSIALFLGACTLNQTNMRDKEVNTALPADIDPVSRSRLPALDRESLDAEGQRIYDIVVGAEEEAPATGPVPLSLYSPKVAEAMHHLNQFLRYQSVLGRLYTEVTILVTAREIDQQYEWTRHETDAREAGVPESVIEAIKHDWPVDGLPPEEALLINYGRQILREHRLDSALFAEAVERFGRQGAFEIAAIMGDYLLAGVMLHAADQHLPEDETPLLPMHEQPPGRR